MPSLLLGLGVSGNAWRLRCPRMEAAGQTQPHPSLLETAGNVSHSQL